MTHTKAIAIIEDGGSVIDSGQLEKRTVSFLRACIKRGWYAKYEVYEFPNPKWAYCLASRLKNPV